MWKIRWRNLINFCLKKTKKIDIIEAIETDQDMVIDIDDQDLDLLLLIVDILGHLQMLTGGQNIHLQHDTEIIRHQELNEELLLHYLHIIKDPELRQVPDV